MKRILYILIITFTIIFQACEDDIPNIYEPAYFVEGYLIVDSPIENIIVMETQDISKPYDYVFSLVPDAEVKIIEGDNEFLLDFRADSVCGYYYDNESYKVKPNTKYELEITLQDGTFISGSTTTPKRFEWINPMPEQIYYPKDTINLPEDSIKIEWTATSGLNWFFIRTRCLDTMYYGKYIEPPTEEFNRRTYKPYADNSRYYNDRNIYFGPLPNTKTPLLWSGVKWYGKNEVSVYCPDVNYLLWFIQVQRQSFYEPLLGTVDGAMGVFGSASEIKDTTFVIKNQK